MIVYNVEGTEERRKEGDEEVDDRKGTATATQKQPKNEGKKPKEEEEEDATTELVDIN